MRFFWTLASVLLLAIPGMAQRHKFQINAETPEGLLLQQAGQESDDAKRMALYEDFLAKYPKHEGAAYAWVSAQPLLLKAGKLDQVIAGGEAVLAVQPDNAVAAYNALQASEQKNDAALVTQWAAKTVDAAKKMIATPKPQDEEEAEIWAKEVDYAKQVITRCEYSYFATSVKMTDVKSIGMLFEGLEKINPESPYVAQAGSRFFLALTQSKDIAGAQALAEKLASRKQANDDMLLFAADANLTAKNYDKSVQFARELTAMLPGAAAPAGVDPGNWDAKKKTSLARGYWIAGAALCAKPDYEGCDAEMSKGLPIIEGNPASKDLLPGAYFYLGLANYSLSKGKPDAKRKADAKKYFTSCAALSSPFQATAQKNLAAIAAGK